MENKKIVIRGLDLETALKIKLMCSDDNVISVHKTEKLHRNIRAFFCGMASTSDVYGNMAKNRIFERKEKIRRLYNE
ncbi:MAG: hypothetical protein RR203_02400 [Synergistaceae bacterium]